VLLGVNVPNFGPGTDPAVLRRWAQNVEGLGYDLLLLSDHLVVTPDVAEQYPAPFYEPFTTLSWLAGVVPRIRLGTTVLIMPYRCWSPAWLPTSTSSVAGGWSWASASGGRGRSSRRSASTSTGAAR
jgi:hypothetical protein